MGGWWKIYKSNAVSDILPLNRKSVGGGLSYSIVQETGKLRRKRSWLVGCLLLGHRILTEPGRSIR